MVFVKELGLGLEQIESLLSCGGVELLVQESELASCQSLLHLLLQFCQLGLLCCWCYWCWCWCCCCLLLLLGGGGCRFLLLVLLLVLNCGLNVLLGQGCSILALISKRLLQLLQCTVCTRQGL